MIHYSDIVMGFFDCGNEEATPDTYTDDLIWMSHLDSGFADAGSCLYGDCEVFI